MRNPLKTLHGGYFILAARALGERSLSLESPTSPRGNLVLPSRHRARNSAWDAELQRSSDCDLHPPIRRGLGADIRPLLPADILPLAASGLPIDVLCRLSVQSVGTLQNTVPLAGTEIGATGEFFELIAALRRLQGRGLLSIRSVRGKQSNRVYLNITDGSDALSRTLAGRARQLLRNIPFVDPGPDGLNRS